MINNFSQTLPKKGDIIISIDEETDSIENIPGVKIDLF